MLKIKNEELVNVITSLKALSYNPKSAECEQNSSS